MRGSEFPPRAGPGRFLYTDNPSRWLSEQSVGLKKAHVDVGPWISGAWKSTLYK